MSAARAHRVVAAEATLQEVVVEVHRPERVLLHLALASARLHFAIQLVALRYVVYILYVVLLIIQNNTQYNSTATSNLKRI